MKQVSSPVEQPLQSRSWRVAASNLKLSEIDFLNIRERRFEFVLKVLESFWLGTSQIVELVLKYKNLKYKI